MEKWWIDEVKGKETRKGGVFSQKGLERTHTHSLTSPPSLTHTHTYTHIYIHTHIQEKKNAFVLLEAKNKSKGGGSVGGRHTIKGKKSSTERKKERKQKNTKRNAVV